MVVYQKEKKILPSMEKNKNVELYVEVAPLVHLEHPVAMVNPVLTLLALSLLSRGAPIDIRGGIQRH